MVATPITLTVSAAAPRVGLHANSMTTPASAASHSNTNWYQ